MKASLMLNDIYMFWQHLLPSRRLLFQCPNFFGNGVVHYGEKLLLDVQMKSSRCSREREEAKSLLLHSRRPDITAGTRQRLRYPNLSIMDLKEYFKRIGFTGLYDKADLPTLCTIHKLHVMTVPFENLSIHCGEKITLDLNVIYKKIVLDHRGGWCFENNLLFSWVLREMGYKFTMLGTKDCNLLKNDSNPMESHLINLVEIDGKPYIADVSYGVSDQMWEPLELIAGKDQPQPPGVFRLLKDGESWTLEKTGRKPLIQNEAFAKCSLVNKPLTKTMFSFFLMPRGTDQFLEASEYLQTNCESLFTQKSICSLQTPTGFRALVGCNYSEVTFNPQEDIDLYDMRKIPDSEIETVLKEKFNITLDSKLTPVNN